MKTDPPTPLSGVSRLTLRFMLLGGGAAWTAHLLLAYAIAEFGVLSGFADNRWAGLDAVSWLLIALSVAMLALAGIATWLSWHVSPKDDRNNEAASTVRFCVRFARASNVTFLAIIAAQSVPIFYFLRGTP